MGKTHLAHCYCQSRDNLKPVNIIQDQTLFCSGLHKEFLFPLFDTALGYLTTITLMVIQFCFVLFFPKLINAPAIRDSIQQPQQLHRNVEIQDVEYESPANSAPTKGLVCLYTFRKTTLGIGLGTWSITLGGIKAL